jgi:hypothetical protein
MKRSSRIEHVGRVIPRSFKTMTGTREKRAQSSGGQRKVAGVRAPAIEWVTWETQALSMALAIEHERSVAEIISVAVNLYAILLRNPTKHAALLERLAGHGR